MSKCSSIPTNYVGLFASEHKSGVFVIGLRSECYELMTGRIFKLEELSGPFTLLTNEEAKTLLLSRKSSS
jgi:hypothetical protein